MKNKPIYCFFKRAFDLLISLSAIVLFAFPMLTVAVAIKMDSKGPVFFRQKRIGKNKKPVRIITFRSMYTDTDPNAPTHLLTNADSHITRVGRFIRKTSIDELPQIYNIFLGQMSFVGPRPALWNQYDLVAERDTVHANDVKPGLTGLAQISGRDELEMQVKAALDGEYVLKRGLLFDAALMLKTVFSVLRREGVSEGGTAELRKREKQKRSV